MGLGQRLMGIAEDCMRSRGLKRIRVTITKTNEPSIRMCQKLGHREKRVVMEKELD
jgi:RimJ/RimL family protein N-acetyltransferase